MRNQDVGFDYIPFFSPEVADKYFGYLKEQSNKYDYTKLALADEIAKVGEMKFRDPDKFALYNKLDADINNISKMVEDHYGGDWAKASTDVIKNIARNRKVYSLGQQEYEKQEKQYPLYQRLKQEGKLAKQAVKNPYGEWEQQEVNPFEQSAFDEQGNYVGSPDYGAYKEAGNYTPWIKEHIADAYNDQVSRMKGITLQGVSEGKYDAFERVKGESDENIQKDFNSGRYNTMVSKFIQDNPTWMYEHGFDQNDPNDFVRARSYIRDTTKALVSQKFDDEIRNDPSYLNALDRLRLRQENQPEIAPIFGQEITNLPDEQQVSQNLERNVTFKNGEPAIKQSVLRTIMQQQHSVVPYEQTVIPEYVPSEEEKQDLQNFKDFIKDIRVNNPKATKGLNSQEVLDLYNKNRESLKVTRTTAYPIQDMDLNLDIRNNAVNAIEQTEWYVQHGMGTRDINGRNGIKSMTGLDYADLQKVLTSPDIQALYNKDLGLYQMTLPIPKRKNSKNLVMNSDGTINKEKSNIEGTKTIYFATTASEQARAKDLNNLKNSLYSDNNNEYTNSLPVVPPYNSGINELVRIRYNPKEVNKFDPNSSNAYEVIGLSGKIYGYTDIEGVKSIYTNTAMTELPKNRRYQSRPDIGKEVKFQE